MRSERLELTLYLLASAAIHVALGLGVSRVDLGSSRSLPDAGQVSLVELIPADATALTPDVGKGPSKDPLASVGAPAKEGTKTAREGDGPAPLETPRPQRARNPQLLALQLPDTGQPDDPASPNLSTASSASMARYNPRGRDASQGVSPLNGTEQQAPLEDARSSGDGRGSDSVSRIRVENPLPVQKDSVAAGQNLSATLQSGEKQDLLPLPQPPGPEGQVLMHGDVSADPRTRFTVRLVPTEGQAAKGESSQPPLQVTFNPVNQLPPEAQDSDHEAAELEDGKNPENAPDSWPSDLGGGLDDGSPQGQDRQPALLAARPGIPRGTGQAHVFRVDAGRAERGAAGAAAASEDQPDDGLSEEWNIPADWKQEAAARAEGRRSISGMVHRAFREARRAQEGLKEGDARALTPTGAPGGSLRPEQPASPASQLVAAVPAKGSPSSPLPPMTSPTPAPTPLPAVASRPPVRATPEVAKTSPPAQPVPSARFLPTPSPLDAAGSMVASLARELVKDFLALSKGVVMEGADAAPQAPPSLGQDLAAVGRRPQDPQAAGRSLVGSVTPTRTMPTRQGTGGDASAGEWGRDAHSQELLAMINTAGLNPRAVTPGDILDADATRVEYAAYYQLILRKLETEAQRYMETHPDLENKRIEVLFQIDSSGRVNVKRMWIRKHFLEQSLQDDVLTLIAEAGPFPGFPKERGSKPLYMIARFVFGAQGVPRRANQGPSRL